MTPNLIRSVAAACLAATLMPAQEEHEVIVRVEKSQGAKASSKATVKHKVTHKKMMKIIERISDDDVPSKERKKLTKALIKMLADAGKGSHEVHVVHEAHDGHEVRDIALNVPFGEGEAQFVKTFKGKPGTYTWVAQGKDKKSTKAKKATRDVWVQLEEHGDAKGVWVTDGKKARVIRGRKASKGRKDGTDAVVWFGPGKNGLIYELNKTIGRGQGQGGKKRSSKKGGDLKARATQLRARLGKPHAEHHGVTVIESDGDSPAIGFFRSDKTKAARKLIKAYTVDGSDYDVRVMVTGDGEVHTSKGKGKRLSTDDIHFFSADGKKGDIREKVQMILREVQGKAKKSGKGKADGFTFEWSTDGKDLFEIKGKEGGYFTIDFDSDMSFGSDFEFDVDDLNAKLHKAGKGGKSKGLIEYFYSHDDEGEGRRLLKMLGTDGHKGNLSTVLEFIGKDAKSKKGGDRASWSTIVIDDEDGNKRFGTWSSEKRKDVVLELLDGEHGDRHGNFTFEVHDEHDEHGEHGEHAEVLEMIQEMRAEMRELREMMQQIRKSLGNSRTTTRRARTVPTLIREETAEPVRRVRRRETR